MSRLRSSLVRTGGLCLLAATVLFFESIHPARADVRAPKTGRVRRIPSHAEGRPTSCSEINDIIQSLDAGGGVIELPAGEWICDEPVVIDRDNVSLVGAGRLKTSLKLKPMNAAPLLVIGVLDVAPQNTAKHGIQYYPVREVRNIEVSGLTLDGNLFEQKSAKDNECYDVKNKKSLSCDNDGGRFIRVNGITIRRANNVHLNDVAAHRNLSGGMVLEKLSSQIYVDGYWAEENAFDGFAGYETNSSFFKNVTLEHNVFSGVSVDFDFDNNVFDGLKLLNNGDNGIFSHSVNGNIYRNMQVEGNGNYGVFFDGRRNNLGKDKDGNDIWEEVPGTCDNTTFADSTFTGNHNVAIRVNSICQGVVIENVSINKIDPAQDCYWQWPGSDVRTLGTYSCR